MTGPNNHFISFFVDSGHHGDLVATLSPASLFRSILFLEDLIDANSINAITSIQVSFSQFVKQIITALGNP
jgi:hypothetical protein